MNSARFSVNDPVNVFMPIPTGFLAYFDSSSIVAELAHIDNIVVGPASLQYPTSAHSFVPSAAVTNGDGAIATIIPIANI